MQLIEASMMNHQIEKFLSVGKFLVIGASRDPNKYGYKVLKWYLNHQTQISGKYNLDTIQIVPIHPKEDEILGVKTSKSLSDELLTGRYKAASVSFITPPSVTKDYIQTILKAVVDRDIIVNFCCQPGSSDDSCQDILEKLRQKGCVTLYNGPCILRDSGAVLDKSTWNSNI
ncbi:hypothetical protein MIR68_003508 [Amoeboaphelidium protococcarum]|nr:hypothetical protein MIR68_003508 [Amoeboaphelidium protococcarum]